MRSPQHTCQTVFAIWHHNHVYVVWHQAIGQHPESFLTAILLQQFQTKLPVTAAEKHNLALGPSVSDMLLILLHLLPGAWPMRTLSFTPFSIFFSPLKPHPLNNFPTRTILPPNQSLLRSLRWIRQAHASPLQFPGGGRAIPAHTNAL